MPAVVEESLSGLLNALDGVAAAEGRVLFAYIQRYRVRVALVDVWVENASKWQAEALFRDFFPSAEDENNEPIANREGYCTAQSRLYISITWCHPPNVNIVSLVDRERLTRRHHQKKMVRYLQLPQVPVKLGGLDHIVNVIQSPLDLGSATREPVDTDKERLNITTGESIFAKVERVITEMHVTHTNLADNKVHGVTRRSFIGGSLQGKEEGEGAFNHSVVEEPAIGGFLLARGKNVTLQNAGNSRDAIKTICTNNLWHWPDQCPQTFSPPTSSFSHLFTLVTVRTLVLERLEHAPNLHHAWTENKLIGFNITANTVDVQTFFNMAQLPPTVSPIILNNLDATPLLLSSPKTNTAFFTYLEHAENTFEFCLSFTICGETVYAKPDYTIMAHDNSTHFWFRKMSYRGLRCKQSYRVHPLAQETLLGITMVGASPIFYKIPITQALITAQYPAQLTIVQRDGMRPLGNCLIIFQCLEAMRALMLFPSFCFILHIILHYLHRHAPAAANHVMY
ncbi:hypothetical protein JOM56_012747 [Amanita muscaria]